LGVMNLLLFWLWINGRRKKTGLAGSMYANFFLKKGQKFQPRVLKYTRLEFQKKINSCQPRIFCKLLNDTWLNSHIYIKGHAANCAFKHNRIYHV